MDDLIHQIQECSENIYKMGESIDVEATARDVTHAMEVANQLIEASNNLRDSIENLTRR